MPAVRSSPTCETIRVVAELPIKTRVARLDWRTMAVELDANGYALTGPVLTPAECAGLVAMYPERDRFRSRIDMTRLRYGVGEYKYFAGCRRGSR